MHVRFRSIRLSTAKRKKSLPLHDLLKGNNNDNNDDNNDNVHQGESESNVIGGDNSHNSESNIMPDDGENQIPTANEVTPRV